MPAEAIRINRRVLLQCSIGAPGLKQPFAQPQQNGALSAMLTSVDRSAKDWFEPDVADAAFCTRTLQQFLLIETTAIPVKNSLSTPRILTVACEREL